MLQVALQPGLPGGRWACLREPCGHDEVVVAGTDAFAATDFLDRLLVSVTGTSVGPGRAWELALCDRDRLLRAVHEQLFGDRIEATAKCTACGEGLEVSFSVRELAESQRRQAPTTVEGPDEAGSYRALDGRRFRLPHSNDLRCVAGLHAEDAGRALLERCLVDGDPSGDAAVVEEAMEAVGPVLDVELDARCPHCEASQQVQFDIASFLLCALYRERRWLTSEVHRLATAYGWSLDEILAIPRSLRREYVALVEAERVASRRALS